MLTHDHFLKKIQSTDGDDQRLAQSIYADWLEDQGDRRCEMIRSCHEFADKVPQGYAVHAFPGSLAGRVVDSFRVARRMFSENWLDATRLPAVGVTQGGSGFFWPIVLWKRRVGRWNATRVAWRQIPTTTRDAGAFVWSGDIFESVWFLSTQGVPGGRICLVVPEPPLRSFSDIPVMYPRSNTVDAMFVGFDWGNGDTETVLTFSSQTEMDRVVKSTGFITYPAGYEWF